MVIHGAGAVLWRTAKDQVTVALVHRPRYNDWSLPKGKVKPGETIAYAAVREVAEETGYSAVLERKLDSIYYHLAGASKVVDYFAARADAGTFMANHEVDELRWLPPAEATALCTYANDRTVLSSFSAHGPNFATILLVRHAKAGKRATWAEVDRLRPLSPAGQQQAAALRILLPLFGIGPIHAAPLVRCIDTVRGLADDMGIAIEQEPLLSEDRYWGNESAAVRRLLDIAAQGGTSVICSQGGVIPDLVATLAAINKLNLGESPQSKKGSVWVLSFTASQQNPQHLVLSAADYLPSPLPKP